MNDSEIFWLILGIAAGYIAGTIVAILTIRQRARRALHPMEYVMPTTPITVTPVDVRTTSTTTSTAEDYIDWDAELAVFAEATEPPPAELPKRRYGPEPKATADEQCPQCGRMFRRVSQHIKLSHKPAPKKRRGAPKATV